MKPFAVISLFLAVAGPAFASGECMFYDVSELKYPPLAIQARIQGVVSGEVEINDLGSITEVKLLGHPLLTPAVEHWLSESEADSECETAQTKQFTVQFELTGEGGPDYPNSVITRSAPGSFVVSGTPLILVCPTTNAVTFGWKRRPWVVPIRAIRRAGQALR
jgi:hypothetical protein